MMNFPQILRLSAASLCLITAAGQLNAHDLKLGTKVDHHVVQDEKTDFSTADKEVCAQISLVPSHDGKVTFVWTKDDVKRLSLSLPVKESARYRTHSCVKTKPGQWHVAVLDEANVTLAEKTFHVSANGTKAKSAPAVVQAPEQNHQDAAVVVPEASVAPAVAHKAPKPEVTHAPANEAPVVPSEAAKEEVKKSSTTSAEIPTVHANHDAVVHHQTTSSDTTRPMKAERVHAPVETAKVPVAPAAEAPTASVSTAQTSAVHTDAVTSSSEKAGK